MLPCTATVDLAEALEQVIRLLFGEAAACIDDFEFDEHFVLR